MTSLFSITIILTAGRIRQAEHNALAYLYHATNGPSWTNNNGWDVGENGTDPCRRTRAPVPYGPRSEATVPYTGRVYNATPWFGVGCLDPCDDYLDGFDCTAGRISSIMLRENGMSGSTTGWTMVGEMRNLTVLDLSYNSITGVLPTELGRIHNLDSLQLRDNSFIGDLPTELSRFNAPDGLNRTFGSGELKEISLANNRLRGHLPPDIDRHAASLQMFDVGGNIVSGTLPPEYGKLPKLQVLYLRHNSISGTLPQDFGAHGGLGSVRFMSLHGNLFSGTLPPSIGGLTELTSLELGGESLSGTLPTTLGLLSKLQFLHLNDNRFSGSLPTELGLLNELETFDAYNNQFDGAMPSELGQLINLRLFYVPNEQLLPLRMRYCQQRLPNVGKYSYRIVREEYYKMIQSLCPEPHDTLNAFGTLAQISGDV